jgi:hypothetical protein
VLALHLGAPWQCCPPFPPPLRQHLHCPVAWTLLLQHQGRVAGRDRLRQPPQGLHGSRRHAWQSTTPRQTAGQAPRRSRHHQAGLVFRPAGFFTFVFSGAAKRQSRNCFSGHRPVFFRPWTGGTIPVSTAMVPAPSVVTATEIGPLLLPADARARG